MKKDANKLPKDAIVQFRFALKIFPSLFSSRESEAFEFSKLLALRYLTDAWVLMARPESFDRQKVDEIFSSPPRMPNYYVLRVQNSNGLIPDRTSVNNPNAFRATEMRLETSRFENSPVVAAETIEQWIKHQQENLVENQLDIARQSKFLHDADFYQLEGDVQRERESTTLDLETPLWAYSENSDDEHSLSNTSTKFVSSDREDEWSFWRAWYQGFVDGDPLDWELQRRVALVPDVDWEKGAEHIAKVIEEIRARFELEQRIAELEAEKLDWETQVRHQIGGNNPPEAIEDPQVKTIEEIIWAPIEDLKSEVAKDVPDKGVVQQAISKLVAAGKWAFGKVDKAIDAFVVSLGKAGGTAFVGWIVLNSDKIAEIIQSAEKWLSTLP
ncbi:hypothetical protein Q4525_15945 [Shimia thalassica]|uniref:hypothetical protein n=1 Tax=Shimia thalassica TaxID=1715693 RepID=UPI001C097C93|nr:hypothetical protein [Shimia thalassica]MBU2942502.1 hypothetical protein [Shimia thalassica]MDO6504431.1 hypothetical protein [Shimia thalassica]